MNERIKELWAQCVIKHAKTPMNWQNAADEFAQLIVKECAGVAFDEYAATNGAASGESAILKHFGVDE